MVERWNGDIENETVKIEGIDYALLRTFEGAVGIETGSATLGEQLNKFMREEAEKKLGKERFENSINGWRMTELVNQGGSRLKSEHQDLHMLLNCEQISEEDYLVTMDRKFREYGLLSDSESGNFDLTQEEQTAIYERTSDMLDDAEAILKEYFNDLRNQDNGGPV